MSTQETITLQLGDENYQHYFTYKNDINDTETTSMEASIDMNQYKDNSSIYNDDEGVVHFDSSSLPTVEQILNDNAMFSSNTTVRMSNSGRGNNVFDDDVSFFEEDDNHDFHCGDGIIRKNDRPNYNLTSTKNNKTRRKQAIIAFIVFAATSLLITFSVLKSNEVSKHQIPLDEHEYDDGNASDVKKPTSTVVTLSESDIGHFDQTNIDEKLAHIVRLITVQTRTSLIRELSTTGTYQYHAAQWLAQYDTFIPIVPNDDEKKNNNFASWQYVQRYVIVALYFSFEGHQWLNQFNFLSIDKSICDWNNGSTFGIFCNEDKEVITLSLRTYLQLL
jgi:hypothetical protein